MSTVEKPVIAITMGDAAGIGPEIIVKALHSPYIYEICQPLVVGEAVVMKKTIELIDKNMKLHCIQSVCEVEAIPGIINLIDLHNLKSSDVITGQVCPACGKAAMEFIQYAAQLVLTDKAKALVTTPINKRATKLAGYGEIGHLEFLAHLTEATEYATMLVSGPLRVVHLTTHFSLKEACNLVTKERILGRLKLTHQAFQKWGIIHARIAVAALNPHASEGGLFGREEIEEILPAIEKAQSIGIAAHGPFPADSIFNRAINGEFDVVLALYHDQGHIPIKVYGVEKSVSIALGLPFIRTSVDHGTAFDIAGRGIADARSLEEAIKIAVVLNQKEILIYTNHSRS
jgi:4-phospho-D-threonate 3-dehydrogenase / 4-phospho-D-erythronate 3-dehydrogenase